jgi:hypothetical protein
MAKLSPTAQAGRPVFAPIVFRLALRLEQAEWSDITGSASEAVFVVRSAQRLFKLDAVCASFDSWLEAEAAGARVGRDALGRVAMRPDRIGSLPAVSEILRSEPVMRTVEIIRRLALDESNAAAPFTSLTMGVTLIDRLSSEVDGGQRFLARMEAASLEKSDLDLLDYARELTVSLAKAYLEAGAACLLLLQEEDSPELVELASFGALFNIAAYYDVPVIILCRHPVSSRGLNALDQLGTGLYVTPAQAGGSIAALSEGESDIILAPPAWLAATRWEADPDTHPDTIHAWRRQVLGA